MTNEEFEKKWAENRKEVLANNEEYQRIVQSYKSSGWIDYIIFITGFVICENYTKTIVNSIVLQYLLALVGMILIWLGYRLIKSLFNTKQTLEEVEEKIKHQYRDSISN
ncbi:Fis family transcriptional regulator [Prevotella sp.]